MKSILEMLRVEEEEYKRQLLWAACILKGEIPNDLICPITGQMFLEPVRLPDGEIVEKQAIERCIQQSPKNPFNRKALNMENLQADIETREKVKLFLEMSKDSPLIETLKDQQYQPYNLSPSEVNHTGSTNPTPDDLLHMGNHNNEEASISTPHQRPHFNGFNTYSNRNSGGQNRSGFGFGQYWHNSGREERIGEELTSHGLIAGRLEEELGFNFNYIVHGAALNYFITGESPLAYEVSRLDENNRLTREDALQEINGLTVFQVGVLITLYSFGLRGEHLRGLQTEDSFNMGHDLLLTYLIKEQNMNPLEAVQQLNGLSSDTAYDIWCQQTSPSGISNHNNRN